MAEGVVVGDAGGVFVDRVGAVVGVEEGEAGGDGVLRITELAEEMVAAEGEGGNENEGDGCGCGGFEFERVECKGDGESCYGSEDGEETPGKLEEGQFGDVVPEEVGQGGEEKCDGYGEAGEDEEYRAMGKLGGSDRAGARCPP